MIIVRTFYIYIYKNNFTSSNKSMTLPVESRFNYVTIDISPNGSMLIAINTGKIFFCVCAYIVEI